MLVDLLCDGDIRQDNYVKFDFATALELNEAIDLASDLQDLISIATMRPAAFKTLLMFHQDFSVERPGVSFIRCYRKVLISAPVHRLNLTRGSQTSLG